MGLGMLGATRAILCGAEGDGAYDVTFEHFSEEWKHRCKQDYILSLYTSESKDLKE